jgi:drug/metabolite transporter (DMT)-like permease
MARTGDEPMHARSPLRMRLTLAVLGAALSGVGGVLVWSVGQHPAAVLLGVLGLAALVDVAVVVRRLRAGPHYQPGADVPPYRPAAGTGVGAAAGQPVPADTRQRRYLALMAVCLTLITVAWVGVRLASVPAAVVMSLVALVIPPIAATVANAGWSQRDPRPTRTPPAPAPDDAEHGPR